MSMLIIALLWILNFVISWFNAWGCGKTWNESKHVGGWPHFLNWMGAIMSASGFTWCYLIIIAAVGSVVQVGGDGNTPPHALLSPDMFEAFCNLGYLVIVFPILGSGLAITVHSWGVFWRRKTLGNGAVAGYNTFAQVYNMVSAFQHVPGAAKGVGKFFDGKDTKKETLVLLLVVLAVAGGILTTWAIIRSVAKSTAFNRGMAARAEMA